MKLAAEWTDDCSGKKDYDGEIICVSTRYWPRGGGFYVLDANGFRPSDDASKPSASCAIGIRMPDTDVLDIIEKEFAGDTFEEVAAQVEPWAQEQYERVINAVAKEFGVNLAAEAND